MAFILDFSLNKNCPDKKIDFLDTSGIYDAVTNPTGYGTPNPEITDVTSAVLDVIYPNGLLPVQIDVLSELSAMVNGGVPVAVEPSDLGLSDFEDGWGQITYTIAGAIGSGPEILATAEIGVETEIVGNVFYVDGIQISGIVPDLGPSRLQQYNALVSALSSYGEGYTLEAYPGDGLPFVLVAPTGSGSSLNGLDVSVTGGDVVGTFSGGSQYTTYTSFIYTKTLKFFWDCTVSCCLSSLAATASESSCTNCNDDESKTIYAEALLTFDLMQKAICCGNSSLASQYLEELKLICAGDSGCSECD